jgi:hypothetical protein
VAPQAEIRPKVVTVPELATMAELGTPPSVMMGKVQASGTVYRLTPEQSKGLRAAGMPASLISYMELTYLHAVEQNPSLRQSDAKWTLIDGYWYGGTPYGWPREWVIGAPRVGEPLLGR